MNILVTGARGFIGTALRSRLGDMPYQVLSVVRGGGGHGAASSIASIDAITDWSKLLKGQEAVVHLAARVHVMHDQSASPLTEFRRVNTEGTINLARQAAQANVKRFIFISSVKVNGEFTVFGKPFTADDIPAPLDPYGVSKYEAEQQLRQIATETGMEVVIIRPPLVYGPGVKANFASMMRYVSQGWPLPLGAVTDNRRSFVGLDNLVDLIVTCLHHPAAANQTFMVSDGEDLSTADLLMRIGGAMGKSPRLLKVPIPCLSLASTILMRRNIYQRLCASLQVDIRKTQQILSWTPPVSVDDGLRSTVKGLSP
ncbi:SDR family oxidoreductase [Curvibacter sp. CHRR-16]|uniref:UDP-glucose 4-epimerase family protein n=1 Tax=Curvibacter sp. CHRR-16 TaxID=2835872 RepID=UPI001BDB5944|nr:SDR family oxidoreductase [Curvibacter sp. CHRR-16]MBT0571755.1 SDR family oxidoreductase [Curvibacter sp. CHRR-16]